MTPFAGFLGPNIIGRIEPVKRRADQQLVPDAQVERPPGV